MGSIIKNCLMVLIVIHLLNLSLSAGGVITIEETRRNKTMINKTYLEQHMMRMESTIDGQTHIVIFNAQKEELYNIDVNKKTYMVMTKADFEKIGQKMNEVNKLLEDKLKNLPKEQQEMMKKMMGNSLKQATKEVSKTEYERVASSEKVMNWDCDKYIGKKEGVKTSEVWVTDWNNAGLKSTYKSVMQGMEKFFKNFTDQLSSKVSSKSLSLDFGIVDKGMPIKTIHYSHTGEQTGTSLVKEIKEEEIPYSMFIVPSDYKKENPFAKMQMDQLK